MLAAAGAATEFNQIETSGHGDQILFFSDQIRSILFY